jgi:hypothetical protein
MMERSAGRNARAPSPLIIGIARRQASCSNRQRPRRNFRESAKQRCGIACAIGSTRSKDAISVETQAPSALWQVCVNSPEECRLQPDGDCRDGAG